MVETIRTKTTLTTVTTPTVTEPTTTDKTSTQKSVKSLPSATTTRMEDSPGTKLLAASRVLLMKPPERAWIWSEEPLKPTKADWEMALLPMNFQDIFSTCND